MKVKSLLFVGVSLLAFPFQAWAQFYTIMREGKNEKRVENTSQSRGNKIEEEYFYAHQDSMKVRSREREGKVDFTGFFSTYDRRA